MLIGRCHCGALWVYGWEDEDIAATGRSLVYFRGTLISFHFCPTFGCLTYHRTLNIDEQNRRKMAANFFAMVKLTATRICLIDYESTD